MQQLRLEPPAMAGFTGVTGSPVWWKWIRQELGEDWFIEDSGELINRISRFWTLTGLVHEFQLYDQLRTGVKAELLQAYFFSELSWRFQIRPRRSFFANNSFIIEFKGILVKLKKFAHAISVQSLFLRFLDVLQLSYNPLIRQYYPLPWVKGLNPSESGKYKETM